MIQFGANSFKDKPVVVPPTQAPTTAPPDPIVTPTKSKSKFNWPLVVGCVVGGVGFLAITGFLIYYVLKVKRRNAERLKNQ
jgi:hypothetical protein